MNEFAEEVEMLQNALIAEATGGSADNREYERLRRKICESPLLRDIAPKFLRTCRDLGQFWQFIKYEYGTYAQRRKFIWDSFRPLLERLDGEVTTPADGAVTDTLAALNADSVQHLWSKAMERRANDPEGAITLARTLLETVCKHILDDYQVAYKSNADLPDLYRSVSKELNIAPSQHSEDIFKQILGGCTAVVEGLGALRNRLSDAHGRGRVGLKPSSRHAELAVNIAGTVAQFLVATYENKKRK